jgi:hypothetical protein
MVQGDAESSIGLAGPPRVQQSTRVPQRSGTVPSEHGEGAWSLLQRSLKKIADNGVVPAGIGATVVDKVSTTMN